MVTGEVDFEGTVDGAGILILKDEVEFEGSFHFEGLIIVLNSEGEDSEFDIGDGGTSRLFGSVVVVGDESEVELEGNARILYSSAALSNANNISSLTRLVAWREVF